jgi:hypothetical protein
VGSPVSKVNNQKDYNASQFSGKDWIFEAGERTSDTCAGLVPYLKSVPLRRAPREEAMDSREVEDEYRSDDADVEEEEDAAVAADDDDEEDNDDDREQDDEDEEEGEAAGEGGVGEVAVESGDEEEEGGE